MPRDHYATLGVDRRASMEEIQEAYRLLSIKYQASLNADDSLADRQLEEVCAAFRVLSDPEQRKAYDRTRRECELLSGSARRIGDDGHLALRAFAAVRWQSRGRRPRLAWDGSPYAPAIIDAMIAWMIVVLVGVLIAVIARSVGLGMAAVEDMSMEHIRAYQEQAASFGSFGKSLCLGGTLVCGVVLLVFLREHFSQ